MRAGLLPRAEGAQLCPQIQLLPQAAVSGNELLAAPAGSGRTGWVWGAVGRASAAVPKVGTASRVCWPRRVVFELCACANSCCFSHAQGNHQAL